MKRMKFNDNGLFKIMQMADIQEIPSVSEDTVKFLEKALDSEKPDLVILTGDQIKGYGITFKGSNFDEKVRKVLETIVAPMEKRNIPYAITYGNHDDQAGLSTKELTQIYKGFKNAIIEDIDGLNAPATFCIDIYDEEKVKFKLYVINSMGDAKGGGYETLKEEQIQWYKNERDSAKGINGEYIPGMVFQHIPVPEIYNLLKKVPKSTKKAVRAYRTHKDEYYILNNEVCDNGGIMLEPPSIPDINSGEFDALCEKKDIVAMFFGHDHKNNFKGKYNDVDLVYTPSCGFNAYGPGYNRAVRIIELNKNNIRNYNTYTVKYGELCGRKTKNPLKELMYDYAPTTMDAFLTAFLKVLLIILIIIIIIIAI